MGSNTGAPTAHAVADGLIRLYPATSPHGAALLWAHGGGFVAGDLDMPEADHVASTLAAAGTTVLSVDYRLAGDGCRYPAPSDDILRAWDWLQTHRSELGASSCAIGGASAGANLAAGATLRMLHADATTLPDLVLLAYPTLLAVQPAPPQALRAALDADPVADRFGPRVVRAMYEQYLGGPVDHPPIAAVPGRATADQLHGFPPTIIVNSETDELRVSGEAFAASLHAAGQPVEAFVEPGTQHGHLNRPHEPGCAATLARFAAALAAVPPRR